MKQQVNAPIEVRMWTVIAERIRAGEPWRDVLRDYGFVTYYRRTPKAQNARRRAWRSIVEEERR